MVRVKTQSGLTNTWRIGQTFPIAPVNVAQLNLDGAEFDFVKTYTPYESENLEGIGAFFVAEFLTLTRGLPPQKDDECPPLQSIPKRTPKRTSP